MPFDFWNTAKDFVANLAGADPTGTVGHIQELQGEFAEQLKSFSGAVVRNCVPRWQRHLLSDRGCEMDGCGAVALDRCIACGAWACLEHLHVSHLGTGICDDCVRQQIEAAAGTKAARPEARRERRESKQAPPKAPSDAWTEAKALRVLGVSAGATMTQINQAYRKIVAKNHPDLARTEAQRVASEQKLLRVNAAYAFLKQRRQAA